MLMRYGLLLLVEISFAAAFRPTLLAARGNASSVAPWLCDVQVVCRSMLERSRGPHVLSKDLVPPQVPPCIAARGQTEFSDLPWMHGKVSLAS